MRATINKSTLLSDEKLRMTFTMFDKDSSGSISSKELKELLGLNSKYSDKVWNEIIKEIDQGQEEEITYDVFKNLMLKLVMN